MKTQNTHQEKVYIAIDLKSFFASVECADRGLDPMTTNLVVADVSRTEKTICLAVTPSLKSFQIPGRARLFQVLERVKEINTKRKREAPNQEFVGKSCDILKLQQNPALELDFIAAPPRMALYMETSKKIFEIYLKYIAPEDMHAYSIDEVFMDVTGYLTMYKMTAEELAQTMIRDVLKETKITATAGIGSNLYLCKIAMDIVAKHMDADENGVRIASLNEESYRRLLWNHTPITDFWRVGKGYANKLAIYGMYTMGDVARCSIGKPQDFYNEDLLYKLFGVNAELLIDHAWGYEPCTIEQIKEYRPENNSISSGQVLQCPYDTKKGRIIVQEMADLLSLDLVDKGLVTDQIVLTIGYDIENLTDKKIGKSYEGEVTVDNYGRRIPKQAHGTENMVRQTSSTKLIVEAAIKLYDRIINEKLLIRRVTIVANHVVGENTVKNQESYQQLSLFEDFEKKQREEKQEKMELEREKKVQKAVVDIKKKFGKNAVLKGMNFEEGAMTKQRNEQIGGHKA